MDSGNLSCESVSSGSRRLRGRVALIDLEGGGRRGGAVGGINICVCQHPGLAAELACLSRSWSRAGAEASGNNGINGGQGAGGGCQTDKVCCLPPSAFHCLSLVARSHALLWGFDASTGWNEGVFMVKALVILILIFLFFPLCASLLLVIFTCSRGRRNSHTRHQVDTPRPFGTWVISFSFPGLTRFSLNVFVLLLFIDF